MEPVFRIRDIMRQIRILRSVPTEDYGSGSRYGNCSFRQCFQDANKDMFYFPSFFLLITFCRYIFISLQKDNKSLRSHKTVEIIIFLNFLLYDPDPEHWSSSNKNWQNLNFFPLISWSPTGYGRISQAVCAGSLSALKPIQTGTNSLFSVPDARTFWDWSGSLDPYTWLRIRIWIQILLFSSTAFKMPAKNKFFTNLLGLLLYEGT